jgi:hypothetical protein
VARMIGARGTLGAPGDSAPGAGDGGIRPNEGGGESDAFSPVWAGGPFEERAAPDGAGAGGPVMGGAGGRGPATISLEGTGRGPTGRGGGGRKLPGGSLAPADGDKPIRSVSFFGSFRSAITTRVEVWGN